MSVTPEKQVAGLEMDDVRMVQKNAQQRDSEVGF